MEITGMPKGFSDPVPKQEPAHPAFGCKSQTKGGLFVEAQGCVLIVLYFYGAPNLVFTRW